MPSSRETIKRNLRQLKRERGLLWVEIADHLGVEERTVYRWVNDKDPRTPSHDALLKLARLFRVKVDYLLTDHGGSDA
jgi:transcriptional regulator with XRE-family HTH domain